MKLNTRLYRCMIVNLLDWTPPKKKAPHKQQDKGKDPKKKTVEKVYAYTKTLWLGSGSPSSGCEDFSCEEDSIDEETEDSTVDDTATP